MYLLSTYRTYRGLRCREPGILSVVKKVQAPEIHPKSIATNMVVMLAVEGNFVNDSMPGEGVLKSIVRLVTRLTSTTRTSLI